MKITIPIATYDEKCFDLAVAFLADCPDKDTKLNRHYLATAIQKTIEDEIEFSLKATEPSFASDTSARE